MTNQIYIPTECVDQLVDLIKDPRGAYMMIHYVSKEGELIEVFIPYTVKLLEFGGWVSK